MTIPGSGASLRLPSLDALSPVSAAATASSPGKDFRLEPLGVTGGKSGTLGGEAVPGGPAKERVVKIAPFRPDVLGALRRG